MTTYIIHPCFKPIHSFCSPFPVSTSHLNSYILILFRSFALCPSPAPGHPEDSFAHRKCAHRSHFKFNIDFSLRQYRLAILSLRLYRHSQPSTVAIRRNVEVIVLGQATGVTLVSTDGLLVIRTLQISFQKRSSSRTIQLIQYQIPIQISRIATAERL